MIAAALFERVVVRGTDVVPRVSVIVPAFNAEATLGACLDSLCRQTLQPFEIIVVDDASTDTTSWTAAAKGAQTLRMLGNGGPGLARNAGAAVATGDILAFIDSDCVARPDWLEHMVGTLTREQLGAVTGGYGGPLTEAFLPRLQDLVLKLRQRSLPNRIASTISSNLVCRREFFDAAQGFPLYFRRWGDRRAVWGNEDEEFGFLAAQGRNVIGWVDRSAVLHQYRTTLRGYLRQQTFYAERTVMSYLWRPAMAATKTNYSRGSGMRDLVLTGLVPTAAAAAIVADSTASIYAPAVWAIFGACVVAYLALPIGTLRGLRSLGADSRFIAKAYPIVLAVKAAWFVGALRGLIFSLGGFRNGSTQRRIAPAAFVVETRPAAASDVLRDGSVQRGMQALLLLGQPQSGPEGTDPR